MNPPAASLRPVLTAAATLALLSFGWQRFLHWRFVPDMGGLVFWMQQALLALVEAYVVTATVLAVRQRAPRSRRLHPWGFLVALVLACGLLKGLFFTAPSMLVSMSGDAERLRQVTQFQLDADLHLHVLASLGGTLLALWLARRRAPGGRLPELGPGEAGGLAALLWAGAFLLASDAGRWLPIGGLDQARHTALAFGEWRLPGATVLMLGLTALTALAMGLSRRAVRSCAGRPGRAVLLGAAAGGLASFAVLLCVRAALVMGAEMSWPVVAAAAAAWLATVRGLAWLAAPAVPGTPRAAHGDSAPA
ncbi:hypothetical protein OOT46_20430 [Aquabacterium sp. A7-Y]|uniref:hypothetical protein n=1 Tax=Aquabacterium sp. A7-Y TaxID=1349605 RepID=UPI00223CE4AE|nr:hypothetical protein [Aquabacterium sp. A7-Y]MCW7540204.1 hypothetical protein [Aquabacterium sp. A7-Y]